MKRISPAAVTFGVMAVVLGLVAAYIVKQAMHKPEVAKVTPPPPAPAPVDPGVQVVFARNNIPKNGRLLAAVYEGDATLRANGLVRVGGRLDRRLGESRHAQFRSQRRGERDRHQPRLRQENGRSLSARPESRA